CAFCLSKCLSTATTSGRMSFVSGTLCRCPPDEPHENRMACEGQQGMTLEGVGRAEKGYLSERTGGLERPPGQPAAGHAVSRGFMPIPQMQFGEDALHMVLHRVLADHEPRRYFGIGEPGDDQLEHFHFAGSGRFIWWQGLRLAAKLFDDAQRDAT